MGRNRTIADDLSGQGIEPLLADRGNHRFKIAHHLLGYGRKPGRHAGGMGQELSNRHPLFSLARKFGNNLGHAGCQGELTPVDAGKNRAGRYRLCDGEEIENIVLLHDAPAGPFGKTERLVQHHPPPTRHKNDRSVILLPFNIILHTRHEVVESCRVKPARRGLDRLHTPASLELLSGSITLWTGGSKGKTEAYCEQTGSCPWSARSVTQTAVGTLRGADMPNEKTAPYGSWQSPITSDLIVAGTVGLGQVGWMERRYTG